MKLLVLNGPNLNMLGIREPSLYGSRSYADLVRFVEDTSKDIGVEIEVFQSIVRTSSPGTYGRTSSNSTPCPLNVEW